MTIQIPTNFVPRTDFTNANSKITCIIAKDIRTRALAGEPQKQIAAQYGVSAQTVSAIKTGIVWKHIETG